jgi:HAD superfamily hydrolase (TIGR01509 family)
VLKALIFDVDGTLAETEERHRLAFNEAFAREGLDWVWDEALYAELLKVTGGKERIRAFIETLAPERLGEADALAPRLHAHKTQIYTQAVAAGGAPLRPGMAALVAAARAKGLALAIATTTTPANVDALLTPALGRDWRAMFAIVAAGDMVAAKKPAPDVYHLALKGLALPAQAALALEDSRNGVRAAKAAGVPVVAVRSRYAARDDLDDALAIFPCSETIRLDALTAIHAARRSAPV